MYLDEYERWKALANDTAVKESLAKLADDVKALKYFFIAPMEFGTAGLRGKMAAGINAMNIYTVRQATQGFAEYILKNAPGDRSAVIACDSRHNSELFAREAASVLAANGIKTFIFDELRPTPELSFAIRFHKCAAGINITASHNPKEYNGYKAYWADGAQLSPEQAGEVSDEIRKIDIFRGAKTYRGGFEGAVKDGAVTVIGRGTDEAYITEVLGQLCDPKLISSVSDKLTVVYTPLHGAGYSIAPEVLRRAGVKKLYIPEVQAKPDGSFPSVRFPNPEFPEVFGPAKELAKKVGADLIIATDPDADRTGLTIRNGEDFITLTGNQIGSLLLDYILSHLDEEGELPKDAFVVKTIVTTGLANAICRAYGVEVREVLTGFRFIGEQIKLSEESGHGSYVFGFEESYGYLKGSYARDKDAIVATLLITEMAAYYSRRGLLLTDALRALGEKYGWYREDLKNLVMEGLDGAERMKRLTAAMRKKPPTELCGEKVVELRDYLTGEIRDAGGVRPTGLPVSDVLYFHTEKNNTVIVRPSGTEPKIKIYLLASADTEKGAAESLARLETIDFVKLYGDI